MVNYQYWRDQGRGLCNAPHDMTTGMTHRLNSGYRTSLENPIVNHHGGYFSPDKSAQEVDISLKGSSGDLPQGEMLVGHPQARRAGSSARMAAGMIVSNDRFLYTVPISIHGYTVYTYRPRLISTLFTPY